MYFYICILLIHIFNIKVGLKPPHSSLMPSKKIKVGTIFQISNIFEEDGLDYCEIIPYEPFL